MQPFMGTKGLNPDKAVATKLHFSSSYYSEIDRQTRPRIYRALWNP